MTIAVRDLLARAADDRETSPVDLLMGEHWAELDLTRSTRVSLVGAVTREQDRMNGTGLFARGGGAGRTRPRPSLEVLRRKPQAMVKMIRRGGVGSAKAMRDQMAYLAKDGTVELEGSELYFGTPIDETLAPDMIRGWGRTAPTGREWSTHFVVSFPIGTDEGAAYRAGRAWAETLFTTDAYGDCHDYYTAFHTDTDHPHMHVVVGRRGMETGEWLKISKRATRNYDELRRVQVEVAAHEGIELEATPRLARGVHDRPPTDVEVQRSRREGRAVQGPAHTLATALKAATTSIAYARHFEADAALIGPASPDLGTDMRENASSLRAGRTPDVTGEVNASVADLGMVDHCSETIRTKREQIMTSVDTLDRELATIPDAAQRAPLERDAAALKASYARLVPEDADLQSNARTASAGLYRGVKRETDETEEAARIRERTYRTTIGLAERHGFDGETVAARYADDRPVSAALAERWKREEVDVFIERRKGRSLRRSELPDQAWRTMHAELAELHEIARVEIEAYEGRERRRASPERRTTKSFRARDRGDDLDL